MGLSSRERVLGVARLLEDPLRAVRIEAANAVKDIESLRAGGPGLLTAPETTQ